MGVALRLSELHLIHTLTDIPMHICAALIPGPELKRASVVGKPGIKSAKRTDLNERSVEYFLDGCRVRQASRRLFAKI